MPKVKCFSIPGIECFFYSNDHRPPHFHAKRLGKWEYKVNFAEGTMRKKWEEEKMSSQDRNVILKMAKLHQGTLLEEWEKVVR